MPVVDQVEPANLRNGWIQVAVLAVAAVVVLWLASGDPGARLRGAFSPPKAAAAVSAPSPPPAPSCSVQQLELSLSFTGCADSLGKDTDLCDVSKPGVFKGLAYLRDSRHAYLLYVEVDGGYHGPDTYPLAPWPSAGLGAVDGVAKVALRESSSGALWKSAGGWLRVDPGQKSGAVRAGLVYDGAEASVLGLKTIGAWSCG
ncbi:MAG TPA: hypothetical protein VNV65_12225 [Candidatus Solibacter sp.]|jgi:hypothetical protein|nr:hypothetical protein [Candidatus Solibacter sp.]